MGERQIYKIDPDNPAWERVRQVTKTGGVVGIESADSRFFYYTKPMEVGLWRLTLDDKNASELLVVPDLPLVQDSINWALSDNGVFLVRRTEAGAELVFYDFTSESHRTLTRFNASTPEGVSCSGDGQSVFFTQIQVTASDLMLVDEFRK